MRTTATKPISLSSIRIDTARTRETDAFTAVIWHGDVKAAHVSNDGNGGCNMYAIVDRDAFDAIEAHARTVADYDFEHVDQLVTQLLIDNA